MKKFISTTTLVLTMILLLYGCAKIPKGANAIKPFKRDKYLGKWYEIARIDYHFEHNLNNVTANYRIGSNGNIKVENRGYDFVSRKWKDAVGKAKPAGEPNEGKFKVSFFGPFYAGYNIISVDDDYTYALVAGSNLNYLWILSRKTTLPDILKQKYLKMAKDIGYDTSRLIWVEHNR